MNKSLWMLCGIAMIDYMGFGIVLPLLPFYAQSMGASPLQVALIIASFPAMHLVMSPVWGRVSDRWGRRPLLIGGLCASTVSYLAFGLAHTLWVVAASRIVAGAAGATYAVAQAAVADVTSDTDRTVGMGYLGAANGVGVMLGPSIGGYFSTFGLGFPGFVAAGLCLANVLAALIILPETKQRTPRTPTDTDVLTWSAWIRAFRRFPLSVLVTIYFIAASTIEGIMAIFALYLERAISVGAVEVGFLWTWAGMVQIAVRGLLVGRVATRFGEHRAVVVGVSTLVCAMEAAPCCSRNETKSKRPMPASRSVHPTPRRKARDPVTAARKAFLAHLPATAQPVCVMPRGPPWQRSRWSEDSDDATVLRSRPRRRLAGASQSPGYAGTDAPPSAAPRLLRVRARAPRACT